MKKLVLLSLAVAIAIVARGQSKSSQWQMIAGEILEEHSANNFSRILGKALITSAEMKYQMEQIQTMNTTTRNVNINYSNIPNTYVSKENKLMPNEGYTWKYPNDPHNFDVVKIEESLSCSYEDRIKASFQEDYEEIITWNKVYTSPGQNFTPIVRTICKWRYGRVYDAGMRIVYEELINENSSIFPSDAYYPKNYFVPAGIKLIYDVQRKKVLKTGIKAVFTCKWIYQANNEAGLKFEDFKGINNNFPSYQDFFIVFTFSQNQEASTFLGVEIRDNSNGRIVFEDYLTCRLKNGVSYFKIPGLITGEYLVIVEVEGNIREKKQETIKIY